MEAAFFDLDGTLYTGHMWRAIILHHRTHRVNRLPLNFYIYTHLALHPFYKLGLISRKRYYILWARNMAWTFWRMKEDEAERAFRWIADNYVIPRLRQDVLEIWNEHRRQGRALFLVSGTFEKALAVIGERLGADGAIGTELEVKNGRLSGRIVEPLCFGEGKAVRLRAFLEKRPEIEPSRSYAYGDSIYDVPFMEMLGHPVAVYPDEELARYARQKGWEVVGESKGRS